MPIVLDAMGSDNYPEPEIHGAIKAAEDLNIEIILVGQKELLEKKVNSLNSKNLPIKIEHAPDIVDMEDKVVESSRQKPNNSMAVGLDLVRNGKAEAFVTAGNTGGAMFNALRKLGRFKGVSRPGLAGVLPVKNGHSVIIDIGANVDCRPEFLLQFAIMGSVYAEKVLNIKNPRIGLISNGEEPGKGNQLVKDTFPLLSNSGLNFIGNIEGKEFYGGEVDVAITDGFTGNVMIKASEAVAKLILDTLKQELISSTRTKIGALLAKPAFKQIRKLLDPSEIGAVPLLGINGLVFVGHGRSDAQAITNAIKVTHQAIKSNLLEELSNAIQKLLT